MIYFTGDTHGEFERFSTKRFPEQKEMTCNDFVIICGDFGGLWDNSAKDKYWLDWLAEKPFTTLFCDGNHENYDLLYSLPVKDWHGGKVHELRPKVLHLTRGQIYDIDGQRIFTMGGASSHDIWGGILDPADPNFEHDYWLRSRTGQLFRVKGVSWWEQELPSDDEYNEALRNLKQANYKVDCIVTHCAPTSIQQKIDPDYSVDRLTDFLQMVMRLCSFDHWIFGHYHQYKVIDEKFRLLYEQIITL